MNRLVFASLICLLGTATQAETSGIDFTRQSTKDAFACAIQIYDEPENKTKIPVSELQGRYAPCKEKILVFTNELGMHAQTPERFRMTIFLVTFGRVVEQGKLDTLRMIVN